LSFLLAPDVAPAMFRGLFLATRLRLRDGHKTVRLKRVPSAIAYARLVAAWARPKI